MRRTHLHYCASCGDVLYRCDAAVWADDTSRGCGNADMHEKEYCESCCVSLEDEVDAAMHDDDTDATDAWHEGR